MEGEYLDDLARDYSTRLTYDELNKYGELGKEFTFEDMVERINKGVESGASNETLEDVIEEYAQRVYEDNPYILIEPKGEGFVGGDKTFAYGNDDVGYHTFINGERIKMEDYGYDDVAYSETEAKVRLQRILEEREDIDIGMYEGNQRYKTYVDETLPGGKNYTEKVYTFENTDEFAPPLGHFDEDTQIAHKLGRDRLLEDGTLSVHADEIQSDFHKEGSKYGYIDPEQDKEIRLDLGRMSSKISMEFKELKDKVFKFYIKTNKKIELKKFKKDFEILSILRNLMLIGIFMRLAIRDNKKNYLKLIPYAWKMINHRIKGQNEFNNLMLLLKNNFPKFIR